MGEIAEKTLPKNAWYHLFFNMSFCCTVLFSWAMSNLEAVICKRLKSAISERIAWYSLSDTSIRYRYISNVCLRSCGELTFQNSLKGSNERPLRWVIVRIADKLYENISVPRHYYRWNSSAAKLSNKRACGECVSIPNFHIIILATTWSLQEKWIEGKSNSVWSWRSLEIPKAICGWWVIGGIIRTCK